MSAAGWAAKASSLEQDLNAIPGVTARVTVSTAGPGLDETVTQEMRRVLAEWDTRTICYVLGALAADAPAQLLEAFHHAEAAAAEQVISDGQ